jgi:hypothetical protein
MSEQSQLQPIELPGLTQSQIDTVAADVEVKAGAPDLTHPQLHLEGDKDAFTHSFENGRLSLKENVDSSTTVISGSGINVVSGRRIISGATISSISGGSIQISGGDIFVGPGTTINIGGDIQGAARRRASLLLPPEHKADHDVSTISGDIELESLTAKVLKVASRSGNLALQGARADVVTLKTVSGDVELNEVAATNPVSAESVSGDVDVRGGSAPSWRLRTISGNVTARGAQGEVDTSTVSGRTRVS